jgi:hypothetical protein
MRIGLVGCVKNKLSTAAEAQDLYISALFRGRRWFVENTCDQWLVLSALHKLAEPGDLLTPYDVSLVGASRSARRMWAQETLAAIDHKLGDVRSYVFEIHAGSDYRNFGLVDGLLLRGASIAVPTLGLTQGQQLAFYANARKHSMSVQAI